MVIKILKTIKDTKEDRQRTGKGQAKDTNNNVKNVEECKKCLPPEPENFKISDSLKLWSKKKGISFDQLESYIEACLIWHASKGNKYVDWSRTIQNWIIKDLKDKPADDEFDFL